MHASNCREVEHVPMFYYIELTGTELKKKTKQKTEDLNFTHGVGELECTLG